MVASKNMKGDVRLGIVAREGAWSWKTFFLHHNMTNDFNFSKAKSFNELLKVSVF